MRLETLKGSENYQCTVVKLPPKQAVPGLDKLVKVTVFGNDVLTQKTTDENVLYLFFPVECAIDFSYLSENNEYRDTNANKGGTFVKPGYFEDNGRVKAIKFKGIISTGYIAPVSTLDGLDVDWEDLKVGDEFNVIDGVPICKKYKVMHIHASTPNTESKHNKKLKRFSKLVPNQFRFHESTAHLAKNLHHVQPHDIVVITDKWHGTSAVYSHVLVKKKLSIKDRIAKFLGVHVVETQYDHLYASRTVIKNQYINTEATAGYYSEDIWKIVLDEIKEKIEPGISIYGEIVGYLPSGKMIQKGYDYGCRHKPLMGVFDKITDRHKFLVYRITYTKPDGNTIELSWNQIKAYCTKYEMEHVKEIYHGNAYQLFPLTTDLDVWRSNVLTGLSDDFLEKDCKYNAPGTPAEGIVVRIDGKPSYSAYKLKSKRFLEYETKELDKGEINIEEENEATTDIN